jgi:hypothetical protein
MLLILWGPPSTQFDSDGNYLHDANAFYTGGTADKNFTQSLKCLNTSLKNIGWELDKCFLCDAYPKKIWNDDVLKNWRRNEWEGTVKTQTIPWLRTVINFFDISHVIACNMFTWIPAVFAFCDNQTDLYYRLDTFLSKKSKKQNGTVHSIFRQNPDRLKKKIPRIPTRRRIRPSEVYLHYTPFS